MHGNLQIFVQCHPVAIDNAQLQDLFNLFRRSLNGLLTTFGALFFIEIEQSEEGVVVSSPFVEDQLAMIFTLVLIDFIERQDLLRVYNCCVQASFYRVMKKYGVENLANVRIESKRYVAHAEDRAHAREVLLDQANAIECLETEFAVVFVSGRERERQSVEHEIAGSHAGAHGQIINAFCDLQLARSLLRHALLIDSESN